MTRPSTNTPGASADQSHRPGSSADVAGTGPTDEFMALQREVADLKERLKRARTPRPSFRAMHALDGRLVQHTDELRPNKDVRPPRFGLAHKVRGREIAVAHGVAVPQLLAEWNSLAEVDFSDLPERFVFKSVGGAASAGVYPLTRVARNRFRLLTGTEDMSTSEILTAAASLVETGKIRAPFIAEELVPGDSPDRLPDDIKFYTFYGEIGHILLRQVDSHIPGHSVYRGKYIDEAGRDLGNVSHERNIDPAIPNPQRFDELISAAKRLSLATRIPFVRVDLYTTADGIYFGEFTPRPGGRQHYHLEHDIHLGKMWERAIVRLEADIASGFPFRHDIGDHRN